MIDQSEAFIAACCFVFNQMNVAQYISTLYQYTLGKCKIDGITIIQLCKAHVLRNFKNKLPHNKKARGFYYIIIKAIINCETYTDIKTLLRQAFTLSLQKNYCLCVKEAEEAFQNTNEAEFMSDSQFSQENFTEEEMEDALSEGIFFADAKSILKTVHCALQSHSCISEELNSK